MKVYVIEFEDEDRCTLNENGYFLRKEDAKWELNRILSLNDEYCELNGETISPGCALLWRIREIEVEE